MYEEFKKKIEQEKLVFEKEVQKVSKIRSDPKVYSVYQEKGEQASKDPQRYLADPVK